MKKIGYVLLFLILVLVYACSSDNDGVDGGTEDDGGTPLTLDRSALLMNWADNIIIPSYSNFVSVFAEFETSFEVFQADRTVENLETLRASWLTAYRSWQRISMFEIGPAEEDGLRLNINTFPTDVSDLENFVTNGGNDFNLSSNRDVKGFPALDYLINGLGATDAEIVAVYTNASSGDSYINYFAEVNTDIATRVGVVLEDWQNEFRDTFVEADGSSATASVDRYVNDYIFYYERFLRAGKIGIPLGIFTGTTAPDTIEAFYSVGTSNVLFLEGLDAFQDFFNGEFTNSNTTGPSLASFLEELNETREGEGLDEIINNQFNVARNRVTALNAFRTEIEENNPPTDLLLAYDDVQRAVPLLKVDMVAALNIAIDFVDADGD